MSNKPRRLPTATYEVSAIKGDVAKGEGRSLQNSYSPVRFRSSPPIFTFGKNRPEPAIVSVANEGQKGQMPHKRKDLKIEGPNLWYLVGLITSDGNLSKDGRHVDVTSKERNFLESLVEKFKIPNRVCIKNKGTNKEAYRIQISNKNFYEFLVSIGLMPNKSLIINKVKVPGKYFVDFLRGLIDGDGSIRSWRHPTNFHEQWSLRIYSGSKTFINWLQFTIEEFLGCKGRIHSELKPGWENAVYTLKYGKMTAKRILQNCYYNNAFGLDRKRKLANRCSKILSGWCKSKTLT